MTSSDFDLKKYPLPEINDDVLKSSYDVYMSKYTAQPHCSIGFNHFIHQSYNKFEETLKETGTKTFFWVVNGFELMLNDQEKKMELINNIKLYLNIKEIDNLIFLEIWEILMIYKLLNKNPKVNIISEDKNIIKLSLESFFDKINNITNVKSSNISYDTNDCDINIVIDSNNRDSQESESKNFKDILSNTNDALKTIKSEGNLIIKIGDMFTTPTLKLITLLKCLFEQVSIYKPYYSRPTSADKYLICTGFNIDKYNKINKKLEKSVNLINKNTNEFVIDFMSDIDIPKQTLYVITYTNILLSGIQHKEKNKIMKYIKSENYFGQEYQEYVARQIACTEYFLSNFFPLDSKDYATIHKKITDSINKNINLIKEFKNTNTLAI